MKLKKHDYHAVVGLLTIAATHREQMELIAKALAKIVGEKPDRPGSEYYGHVSDAVWSGYGADELLAKLAVSRKQKPKRRTSRS